MPAAAVAAAAADAATPLRGTMSVAWPSLTPSATTAAAAAAAPQRDRRAAPELPQRVLTMPFRRAFSSFRLFTCCGVHWSEHKACDTDRSGFEASTCSTWPCTCHAGHRCCSQYRRHGIQNTTASMGASINEQLAHLSMQPGTVVNKHTSCHRHRLRICDPSPECAGSETGTSYADACVWPGRDCVRAASASALPCTASEAWSAPCCKGHGWRMQ